MQENVSDSLFCCSRKPKLCPKRHHHAVLNADPRPICIPVAPQKQLGRTALFGAVRWNHREAARALLDGGADAGVADSNGVTPLHVATSHGHASCVSLLLERGADGNAQTKARAGKLTEAVAFPPPSDVSAADRMRKIGGSACLNGQKVACGSR